jgi:hypothetical protein
LIPAVDFDVGGVKDVLSKHHGVGACPAEEDNVAGVEASGEELGLAVDELEVVLLTSVPGDGGSKLQVHCHTSGSDQHTSDPDEQGQSNAAR